jgi:hypothetical protein
MAYKYPYDDEEKAYVPPKLKTDRSMWKLMLFSILTFGIYTIIFFIPFSFDLDKIAPKPDRSKTMNFLFVYILSIFTASIAMLCWHYQIAQRIEEALERRDIRYNFGTNDFWVLQIFGSLFLGIGTFVYYHKLCHAMNLLCADYNEKPVVVE